MERTTKRKVILSWFMVLTIVLTCISPSIFATSAEEADSVYYNGNFYTMDDSNAKATAIAIKDGRFIYVGNDSGVQSYIGGSTKAVDMKGKTAIPGIIEGHMHLGNQGESLLQIDAFWKPKAEILAAVKAEADKAQPGEWIRGRGWLNTVWDDTSYPSKEDLDAVAPNNPVVLTRADGHMSWVNSKALELAGITKETPDPQGGEILKTAAGEVLGCLTDTAMTPVSELVPEYSAERKREALLLAQDLLFSYGITNAMDAGVSVAQLDNYKYLYENGSMKLRVYPLIRISEVDSDEMRYVQNNAPTGMLYDNRFTIRAVKTMGDGSLGARSAAMLTEYSDRHGHIGNYRYTDEELYDIIKPVYDAGYQIGHHAIGDGANHQIIDAFEKAMQENPQENRRLRIEHFQILTEEDIDRALSLGILPSMQQTHATSDLLMAEDRMGPERIKGAYAWRTIINKGSIIIGGSDAPVELVNPYHGLYAAVARKMRSGDPDGGWYPNEKMTREEALKSFTIWSAYGQFQEDMVGSIEVGKLADFAIIDRDYMTCPENDIKDILALTTVVQGEVVYERPTSIPTVVWEGLEVEFASAPVNDGGTIKASVERLADNMGAECSIAGNTATVSYNGKSVELEVTGGNVSIRDMFQGLGYTVNWYQNSKCISISK